MEQITGYDIIKATGGVLLCGDPSIELHSISLDSRKMEEDALFVPIIGERVDAHDFLKGAFETGARAAITSRGEIVDPDRLHIQVEDTRKALQDIGRYCRKRLSLPIIGITGSVGKTTTREMVSAALKAQRHIFSTTGNHNGQLGVPIMLAEIPQDAEAAVLEMGMSLPGEMKVLGEMVQVSMAIMTNIGVSHIENLGSQENICKEKLHIIDGMGPDGTLILNGDDPILIKYAGNTRHETVTYGLGESCHYRAVDIRRENTRTVFEACHDGKKVTVRLGVPGIHNVSNAMAAIACADRMGISMEEAGKALEQFDGFTHRLEIEQWNDMTLIDDAYNASPDSMRAALEVLSSMEGTGRRIAVLADMLELGPDSPEYHRQVGEYGDSLNIDEFICIGSLARNIARGIVAKPVHWYQKKEEALPLLKELCRPGDMILWKGSNGMKLNDMIQMWKGKRNL